MIHIRHTKVYLFYAKFPNTYLSRIYEHGAKYSQLFPSPEDKITLCQSPAYSMNNAADQAKLFRDLAKLLWYLSSGRSHVGYLCNCPRNSFVEKLVWFRMRLVLTGSPGLYKIVLWFAEWRITNRRIRRKLSVIRIVMRKWMRVDIAAMETYLELCPRDRNGVRAHLASAVGW